MRVVSTAIMTATGRGCNHYSIRSSISPENRDEIVRDWSSCVIRESPTRWVGVFSQDARRRPEDDLQEVPSVADKLTQQITDALSKAAAEPAGLPLYAGKSDPGLFPGTAAGKLAAQKCLADGLVRVVGESVHGKTPREQFGLTETGWNYLLTQVNPKQVLEDFVRVLEARRGEVGELLETAQRMADSLQGLKEAVTRILPSVMEGRIEGARTESMVAFRLACESGNRLRDLAEAHDASESESPAPPMIVNGAPESRLHTFCEAILARLRNWTGAAGDDCPLPRLFQILAENASQPTIGEFHDCLRRLHASGDIYLHPWTGPLYALPEPAYALLAGHNIAYYASVRR